MGGCILGTLTFSFCGKLLEEGKRRVEWRGGGVSHTMCMY